MSTSRAAPGQVPALGIIVNPFSGRDVRRTLGQATTSTHEVKRGEVKRLVVGAAAAGIERILLAPDLFRISESAVETLELETEVRFEFVELDYTCRAGDTEKIALAMRAAGARALVVLGGDGTSRVVAKAWPDAPILPLSTGTNNVFPLRLEATTAGAAAGLVAAGRLPLADVSLAAKVVHAKVDGGREDLALIDATFLRDDRVGNLLSYEASRIAQIVLARAEPDAVGMSPIGGLLEPAGARDDFGIAVECGSGAPGEASLLAPISPGVYRTLFIRECRRLAFGESVSVEGPGVLAFDGDREQNLEPGQRAELCVRRDGPRVIDPRRVLALAAERGLYGERSHWHGPVRHGDGGGFCC